MATKTVGQPCWPRVRITYELAGQPPPGLSPGQPVSGPGGLLGIRVALKLPDGEFPGGLVVRIPGFACQGPGSIPGRGTEIPQAAWRGQKKKEKNLPDGFHGQPG